MLWMAGKTVLLYFIVIIIIRFLGKSAFAQLTAHDLAAIFLVITLASGPIITEDFSNTLLAMIVVSLVHITLSKLIMFNRVKSLFIGKPAIVIKHGKLIRNSLKHFHVTLAELLSELREKGYPDITQIDYAIIEPYGGVSVIPKKEIRPVTPVQLNIQAYDQGLPVAVILEGDIQWDNLYLIKRDEAWLKHEMLKQGYASEKNIFYAAVRELDHTLIIDEGKTKDSQALNINPY